MPEQTRAEMACKSLDVVYNSKLLRWHKDIQFVIVNMDGCMVYTPCSHIDPDKQKVFRDKIQEVYEISKNKS